jgi:hypothetical protein
MISMDLPNMGIVATTLSADAVLHEVCPCWDASSATDAPHHDQSVALGGFKARY